MKRKVSLCMFLLGITCMLNAQDVILKTNGDEIQAKVQEVGDNEVKYKKFGNESGPAYTMLKSEIFMITYEGGSKDVFGRGKKTATTPATAQTSTSQITATSDLPPAAKAYKVGDIYNENGVKGVVVQVTDGGRHGLIMSLDVSTDKWLKDKDAKFGTAAFYEDDGAKNMAAIEQYINSGNATWDAFPLFQWAKNMGAGWYIPAKDELITIAEAVNGSNGDSQTYNETVIKTFNKKIKSAKGKSLFADGLGQNGAFRQMFGSTEAEGGMIYNLQFVENTGSALVKIAIGGGAKKGKLNIQKWSKTLFTGGSFTGMVGSRAVHKF